MTGKRKTTASVSSVGADGKQPNIKKDTEIIANETAQINLQATNNCNSPEKSGCSLQTVSMTELYDTLYPPRTPVVDGFLYGGTYLFVGAPKVGKSFFMGQLAYHIAMGIPLWDYPVRKGTVLYLALEDDYARLQRRLSQMFGIESADNLYFATQAKTLKEGLDGELEEFVKQHTDARLIIIDTLQKVREVGGETFSYSNDYEIVTKLKAFSDKYGICLLVVHHTRKMESGDSFDMISGTNGLLGAADGAFIMQKKKRTDNTAVLDIVGRDQPDQELTIEFDRERCIWKFKKAETELWKQPPNPLLEAINGLLTEDRQEWEGTATELLKLLPDMQLSANVLSRRLNVVNSQLLNDYGIFYDNKRGHERRIILKRLERNE
nr:helicase RepA family protein [uncultured Schaedlerella sp.]